MNANHSRECVPVAESERAFRFPFPASISRAQPLPCYHVHNVRPALPAATLFDAELLCAPKRCILCTHLQIFLACEVGP